MAKREVSDCDCCGKESKQAQRISVKIGRNMDAAGSMENEYADVDLCPCCMAKALNSMVIRLPYEEAKQWVKMFAPKWTKFRD